MQIKIQKAFSVIYAIMSAYWCWIFGASLVSLLEYSSSVGLVELSSALPILLMPIISVLLIWAAFFKKLPQKAVRMALVLMVVNVAVVAFNMIFTVEYFGVAAYQTGYKFFVGTPIVWIFDIFENSVSIIVVTVLNIFAVKLQGEDDLRGKQYLRQTVFLAKAPYTGARKLAALAYGALCFIWAVVFMLTALAETPRWFEAFEQGVCIFSAILLAVSGCLACAKVFAPKVSRLSLFLCSGLAIVSLLPARLIGENEFDIFYGGALETVFGNLADNPLGKILLSPQLLYLAVVLLALFIKLGFVPKREEMTENSADATDK